MTIEPGDLSGCGIEAFPKQFILREAPPRIAGAKRAAFAGWHAAAAPHLPLRPILAGGRQVGLLIGWATVGGMLGLDDSPLQLPADATPADLRAGAGRYAFLWADGAGASFHLDAGGQLAAVYCPTERTLGATPAILSTEHPIVRDAAQMDVFAFPRARGFLPFGLCGWTGLARLLPNHALDLATFTPARTWPGPGAAFEDKAPDGAEATREVAAIVRATMLAILAAGRPTLYLSGGHDSRMVLAAARDGRASLVAETMGGPDAVDTFIAARVAAFAGVPHRVVAPVPATDADVAGWLDRIGWCLYENVAHHVATVRANDSGFFPLTGTGAEILRASNWQAEDLGAPDLSLDILLDRLRLPPAAPFVAAGEAWLAGLPPMRRTAALDVAKIEMIHACWAAAGAYGHDVTHPSLLPFTDGRVFDRAMAMPEDYKMENRAYRDFVGALWPELLDIPANKVTGLDRLRFPKKELKKLIPTELKRMIKPYR